MRARIIMATAFATILCGCADQGYSVIATTATVIGVNLAQQPSSGGVDATLGYKRGEVAFVPTNRTKDGTNSSGTGAKDTTDVLMELNYSSIFSTTGNIYQRLAVGPNAVATGGAAVMFAKTPSGTIDTNAVSAVSALTPVSAAVESTRAPLVTAYMAARGTPTASTFDQAAAACTITSLGNSLAALTSDQITCVKRELKTRGINVQ